MVSLYRKSIKELKGIGDKKTKLFGKLGVFTVGALLHFYPRKYKDWSHPVFIEDCCIGEESYLIRAQIAKCGKAYRIRKGMTLYKFVITDGKSDMDVIYYNNPYMMHMLLEGKEYLFYGKVQGTMLKKKMNAPEFMPFEKKMQIQPIYPQTEGLSRKQIITAMQEAFKILPFTLKDPIPDGIRENYDLCDLRTALKKIHFPSQVDDIEQARRRLAFEELLTLQLGLLILKLNKRKLVSKSLSKDYTEEYYQILPFSLTWSQKKAIEEAIEDLKGHNPMNRLLQGDVGSGKTVVAIALCYSVVKNNRQVAFMAPTEILARQHYESIKKLLRGARVNVALLTGAIPLAQKREILDQLQKGDISLIVGTHVLFSKTLVFKDLALVITDEQHRFGVNQRSALLEKGENVHTLVMSATPIPRTLALLIYGDLDVSILDELPPGRQKIASYVIDSSKRIRAFHFIKNHLDVGRQAYIICHLVEENNSNLIAVETYVRKLQEQDFAGYRIGMLHGKMKSKEKESLMQSFLDGEIQLLIATTVVEVGVDVPNAVIMFIENAERYGLSQLHQLRGRVGRGTEKSTCILLSDSRQEKTQKRLQIICQTTNGFQIAEEDLHLRGPGDFFGSKQHGLPDLKMADMLKNASLLTAAQKAAADILADDPELKTEKYRGLKAQIKILFDGKKQILS